MSVIYGNIIEVAINTDVAYAQKPGTYKGYRIVYRDETGAVREFAKAMQSLKLFPTVQETLKTLAPGDDFTLVQEKNASGFLDLVSLTPGKLGSDLPAKKEVQPVKADASGYVRPAVGGKVVGSTYETPEERKLKQRLIVRQSSFDQARQFNATSTNLDFVFEQAEKIEKWVYRGLDVND